MATLQQTLAQIEADAAELKRRAIESANTYAANLADIAQSTALQKERDAKALAVAADVERWRAGVLPAYTERFAVFSDQAAELRRKVALVESLLAEFQEEAKNLYAYVGMTTDAFVEDRLSIADVACIDAHVAAELVSDDIAELVAGLRVNIPDWINGLRRGRQPLLGNINEDMIHSRARQNAQIIAARKKR